MRDLVGSVPRVGPSCRVLPMLERRWTLVFCGDRTGRFEVVGGRFE